MGYPEPDWAAHEARVDHLADMPLYARRHFLGDGKTWTELVRDASGEVVVSLVLLQIRSALAYCLGPDWHELAWRLAQILNRRRPVVSAADAVWAVRVAAAMPDTYESPSVMDAATALAVWCDQPGDPGLLHAVEKLAATVDAHSQILARDRARIRKRLLSLRAEVPAGAPLEVTMIRPDDGWSAAVLERAARWQGDRGRANLLLRHLLAATGSKPSRRWLERAATLLQDPGAAEMLRILVESAATAEPADNPGRVRRGTAPPGLGSERGPAPGRVLGRQRAGRGLDRPGAARHRRPFNVRIQPRRRRVRRLG